MRAKKLALFGAFLGCVLLLTGNVLAVRFGFVTQVIEWGEESIQNAAVVSLLFLSTWLAFRGLVALGWLMLGGRRERRGS